MPCLSPEVLPPRARAALAAVGLVLIEKFPEVAVPSLRRVTSAPNTNTKATRRAKPRGARREER